MNNKTKTILLIIIGLLFWCQTARNNIPVFAQENIGITPAASINAPSNLIAKATSQTQIAIAWKDNSRINNFEVDKTKIKDVRTGQNLFLKGIGYSPFFPHETPMWGANLPNDNRYLPHLSLIKNLNANFLLVFPQFMPRNFFIALNDKEFLYAQDIYVDGYTEDLLDADFQKATIDHIKKVIDHTYSVGQPDRLVFFSIGDEINAGTIYRTDTGHSTITNFEGKYIKISDRTPSEVAIAKLMDSAMTYEHEKYGIKHLYCHTSWTHIGPVSNRSDLEVSQQSVFFADFGDIVCMNIYEYARGVVSSPPGSHTGTSHQGYLEDLIKISDKPIVITQNGLSTSPVAPNPAIPGFGGNSDEKVSTSYSQVWNDVTTATGAEVINGLVWFEFMDEWWKVGDVKDENSHADNDPEEWFGMYSVNLLNELSPKGDIPNTVKTLFSR